MRSTGSGPMLLDWVRAPHDASRSPCNAAVPWRRSMSSDAVGKGAEPADRTRTAATVADADAAPALPHRTSLTGLSWRGGALLLAVCVVNALRRNINSRLLREDALEWLIDVGQATAGGLLIGVPVVLAVIVALN